MTNSEFRNMKKDKLEVSIHTHSKVNFLNRLPEEIISSANLIFKTKLYKYLN